MLSWHPEQAAKREEHEKMRSVRCHYFRNDPVGLHIQQVQITTFGALHITAQKASPFFVKSLGRAPFSPDTQASTVLPQDEALILSRVDQLSPSTSATTGCTRA